MCSHPASDRVTAHTARLSMTNNRPVFLGRILSRFGGINWPSRFPDLSKCDYFVSCCLKKYVQKHKSRSLFEDLREAIRVEVVLIERAMLNRGEAKFRQRFEKFITENGRNLGDIIF